ncbi:hypothetical protein [Thalassoroseus pseudoceratinae]|uniref:hypothetical protein n=1 Tax=Thalassoroseus pseudoceratinae TaxID=2713176 RepID=UPI00142160B4|nr:hypothetical protein [Thalassoroseus pseudoceratinae]
MGTFLAKRHLATSSKFIRRHTLKKDRQPTRTHRLVRHFRSAADEELVSLNRTVIAIGILALLPVVMLLALLLFFPDVLTIDITPGTR